MKRIICAWYALAVTIPLYAKLERDDQPNQDKPKRASNISKPLTTKISIGCDFGSKVKENIKHITNKLGVMNYGLAIC